MKNIGKYLKEYSEQYALEINDVRILMLFVDYVNKLQPHRDSQGFLLNTDVDDTMRQPLSDEEIKQKLSVIISSSNSGNEKLESILELINHRPNEWVRVEDVREFLFNMSERHEDKLCFKLNDIIKFTNPTNQIT